MISVAAAVVFDHRGRVLITRRKPGESLEGYWEFPGGKIEEGESPQECIKRELFEELGINAEGKEIIGQCIYTYRDGPIKLIGVRTEIKDRNFTLKVHDRLRWVSLEDLLDYRLAPADIPLAKKIIQYVSRLGTKQPEAE